MKNLFVVTNIVIDLLAKRAPFYASAARIFSLADKQEIKLFISALTVANTHYMLSRLMSSEEAREILRRFRILVKVLPLDEKMIDLALNDPGFRDVEDAFQYYAAVEFQCDCIVTRNAPDFKSSVIPVMGPEEFLATIN